MDFSILVNHSKTASKRLAPWRVIFSNVLEAE